MRVMTAQKQEQRRRCMERHGVGARNLERLKLPDHLHVQSGNVEVQRAVRRLHRLVDHGLQEARGQRRKARAGKFVTRRAHAMPAIQPRNLTRAVSAAARVLNYNASI